MAAVFYHLLFGFATQHSVLHGCSIVLYWGFVLIFVVIIVICVDIAGGFLLFFWWILSCCFWNSTFILLSVVLLHTGQHSTVGFSIMWLYCTLSCINLMVKLNYTTNLRFQRGIL